ncbi:MAG: AraC family transcriptional regulator [Eubacteriales bacterium]|nr:AraC family transcriptional regulator [Eubacteriales bacterium]
MPRTQNFNIRQSMKRDTFEVFHYRDARMQKVELHHHIFYEVYYFLSGEVDYNIEGKIYKLQPHDLLFISPTELHQPLVDPNTPYERIVLWINRGYLNSLSSPLADLTQCFNIKHLEHNNLVRPTLNQIKLLDMRFEQLTNETQRPSFGSEIYSTGLFMQFMVELNRMFIQTEVAELPVNDASPLIKEVLSFIDNNFSVEDISLASVAERFFISKYHLSRQFNSALGISLYKYITLKRMQKASIMLSNGQAPSQVSLDCGYNDYSNFYRAFLTEYGISPSEYAKRCI